MGDRIFLSVFALIILIVPGLIGVFYPELSYRMTATNTLKKKPSKSALKRYKISGYVLVAIGILVIIYFLLGYAEVENK